MVIPDQFSLIRWLKDEAVALVNDEEGKKLVLKSHPHSAVFAKFSETVNEYTRVLRTIMPFIHKTGEFHYRGFVEGEMSGDTDSQFGFNPKNLEKIDPKILAQGLYELQNLSGSGIFVNSGLEVRKSSWFQNNLKETEKAVGSEFEASFPYNVDQFMRKYGRMVDLNSKYLVNGDLHPQNIFVNCLLEGEGKIFMISDWDLLHFNNPAYDLADLYIWSWKNPAWRDKLITEFKALWQEKSDELADCLIFCQVYFSCQMIKHVYLMREKGLSGEAENNAQGLLENSKELLKQLVKVNF